jgi:sulfur carrier protein
MKINLNNTIEELNFDQITIEELIKYKNFTFRLLITKINDKLVKKEDRSNAIIRDGDDVIILHLISGG